MTLAPRPARSQLVVSSQRHAMKTLLALLISAMVAPSVRGDRILNECVCIDISAPVCGSNGRTYQNICLMNCANPQGGISVAYKGRCKGPTTLRPYPPEKLYRPYNFVKRPYYYRPKKANTFDPLHYIF